MYLIPLGAVIQVKYPTSVLILVKFGLAMMKKSYLINVSLKILHIMKYIVKVKNAYVSDQSVKNEKLNKEVVLINLGLTTPIEVFNKETGEKQQKKQLTLQLGDFQSLLAQNSLLIHLNQYNNRELMEKFNLKEMKKVTEEGTVFVLAKEVSVVDEDGSINTELVEVTEPERVRLRYDSQLKYLCGATICVEKVEITEVEKDEDGKPMKDNEGNPKEVFKGFGETIFHSVELDAVGAKLAEKEIFG